MERAWRSLVGAGALVAGAVACGDHRSSADVVRIGPTGGHDANGGSTSTGGGPTGIRPSDYCSRGGASEHPTGPIQWHLTSPMTEALTDAPGGNDQAVVWTGTEMLVWGGDHLGSLSCPGTTGGPRDSGARYDPSARSWSPMATTGAPTGRNKPVAVWTGAEMIVWGGYNDPIDTLADGARYAPGADRWSPVSAVSSPPHSCGASTAWTGQEMILWLGEQGGWRYDPVLDRWRTMPDPTMPYHLNGPSTAAAWTGRELIAVGGINWLERDCTREAGGYDPAGDRWRTLAAPPMCVRDHQAFWAGDSLLLWSPESGALYDPCADSWRELPNAAAPVTPTYWAALWAGTQLLLNFFVAPDSEPHYFRYDPWADTWAAETPPATYATAVWADGEVVALDY